MIFGGGLGTRSRFGSVTSMPERNASKPSCVMDTWSVSAAMVNKPALCQASKTASATAVVPCGSFANMSLQVRSSIKARVSKTNKAPLAWPPVWVTGSGKLVTNTDDACQTRMSNNSLRPSDVGVKIKATSGTFS